MHGIFKERRDAGDAKHTPVAFVITAVTDCPSGGDAVNESKNVVSSPPSVRTCDKEDTLNRGTSLSIIVAAYMTSDN